jgi:hypothetical protein
MYTHPEGNFCQSSINLIVVCYQLGWLGCPLILMQSAQSCWLNPLNHPDWISSPQWEEAVWLCRSPDQFFCSLLSARLTSSLDSTTNTLAQPHSFSSGCRRSAIVAYFINLSLWVAHCILCAFNTLKLTVSEISHFYACSAQTCAAGSGFETLRISEHRAG